MRKLTSDFGAAQVVLEREGVEGEEGKIDTGGGLDDVLDGLGALLVAKEALEGALAGAQRPLPSMMMATCFGILEGSSCW